MLVTTPSSTKDVGKMLCSIHPQEKAVNRKMLSTIMTTIRYLGRQGLALRGRCKSEEDTGQKGELDSNVLQLLYLCAEDIKGLKKWMSKSQDKYTSPDIQNEILSIMALSVLRSILNEVAGKYYSIMIDETTDNSNVEQMVFCLCHVDDNFDVHEEFIGLYSLDD